MKKAIVSLVSAAALATVGMAAASNSMAASDQSFSSNPSGIFISGNAGYGQFRVARPANANGYNNKGFAWNGNVGYQFNKYLAIESGFTKFANVKVNGGTTSAPVQNTYGIDLLAKGILPINSQFDLFAKAGAMRLSSKTTSLAEVNRYVPEFGIGTSYAATRHVSVTVQGITTLAVKGSGTNAITMPATYAAYAGLSYKFNV